MGFVPNGKVFLTGATGILGGYIVKQLLLSTDCDVYCLVRAASQSEALRRLISIFEAYDPKDTLKGEFLIRVKPVLGDVTQPRLGLNEEEYKTLTEQIDVTIHSAANTNLFLRYSKLEPINVGGAKNMIEFALSTPSKRMTYVSTYTVTGDRVFDRNLIFKETDLDVGQGFEFMTYQRSKFTAEKLVRAAGEERGLVWNIVRPGQIFGESGTGYYPQGQTNISGLFNDIFKTIIETKYAFDSDTFYDIVPVDYVSKAVIHITFQNQITSTTIHAVNPAYTTYRNVVEIIIGMGYQIEIIPVPEYRRMVFERELSYNGEEYKSATVAAFRSWFKRSHMDFSASCITDCTIAREMLEPVGITCPKLDSNLIGTYIQRGIGLNYFPMAPARVEMRVR